MKEVNKINNASLIINLTAKSTDNSKDTCNSNYNKHNNNNITKTKNSVGFYINYANKNYNNPFSKLKEQSLHSNSKIKSATNINDISDIDYNNVSENSGKNIDYYYSKCNLNNNNGNINNNNNIFDYDTITEENDINLITESSIQNNYNLKHKIKEKGSLGNNSKSKVTLYSFINNNTNDNPSIDTNKLNTYKGIYNDKDSAAKKTFLAGASFNHYDLYKKLLILEKDQKFYNEDYIDVNDKNAKAQKRINYSNSLSKVSHNYNNNSNNHREDKDKTKHMNSDISGNVVDFKIIKIDDNITKHYIDLSHNYNQNHNNNNNSLTNSSNILAKNIDKISKRLQNNSLRDSGKQANYKIVKIKNKISSNFKSSMNFNTRNSDITNAININNDINITDIHSRYKSLDQVENKHNSNTICNNSTSNNFLAKFNRLNQINSNNLLINKNSNIEKKEIIDIDKENKYENDIINDKEHTHTHISINNNNNNKNNIAKKTNMSSLTIEALKTISIFNNNINKIKNNDITSISNKETLYNNSNFIYNNNSSSKVLKIKEYLNTNKNTINENSSSNNNKIREFSNTMKSRNPFTKNNNLNSRLFSNTYQNINAESKWINNMQSIDETSIKNIASINSYDIDNTINYNNGDVYKIDVSNINTSGVKVKAYKNSNSNIIKNHSTVNSNNNKESNDRINSKISNAEKCNTTSNITNHNVNNDFNNAYNCRKINNSERNTKLKEISNLYSISNNNSNDIVKQSNYKINLANLLKKNNSNRNENNMRLNSNTYRILTTTRKNQENNNNDKYITASSYRNHLPPKPKTTMNNKYVSSKKEMFNQLSRNNVKNIVSRNICTTNSNLNISTTNRSYNNLKHYSNNGNINSTCNINTNATNSKINNKLRTSSHLLKINKAFNLDNMYDKNIAYDSKTRVYSNYNHDSNYSNKTRNNSQRIISKNKVNTNNTNNNINNSDRIMNNPNSNKCGKASHGEKDNNQININIFVNNNNSTTRNNIGSITKNNSKGKIKMNNSNNNNFILKDKKPLTNNLNINNISKLTKISNFYNTQLKPIPYKQLNQIVKVKKNNNVDIYNNNENKADHLTNYTSNDYNSNSNSSYLNNNSIIKNNNNMLIHNNIKNKNKFEVNNKHYLKNLSLISRPLLNDKPSSLCKYFNNKSSSINDINLNKVVKNKKSKSSEKISTVNSNSNVSNLYQAFKDNNIDYILNNNCFLKKITNTKTRNNNNSRIYKCNSVGKYVYNKISGKNASISVIKNTMNIINTDKFIDRLFSNYLK